MLPLSPIPPSEILAHLTTAHPQTQLQHTDGATFIFSTSDRKLPYATLLTSDASDTFSNLAPRNLYRLNFALSKPTYLSLFGPPPTTPISNTPTPGYDYTTPNTLLPHPTYAQLSCACIIAPSVDTFHTQLKPLLAEAFALSLALESKRHA